MKDGTWKGVWVLAAAIAFVLSMSGYPSVQADTPSDPVRGGVLRYGMLADPVNWSPHNVVDCQSQVVMCEIWSGLLRYDDQEQLVGDLAESWEWAGDKTVVFHLRKNVKWHNGDVLTAEQVVKSENHRLDPKAGVDAKTLSDIIDKWEAVDAATVKLTLKRHDITILRWLTIVPGKDFVLHPSWDEKTCGRSAETTVGTGPFKYKSYEPGVEVRLVKNPDYFLSGMPYLDGIRYAIIPDREATLTGLLAGELDMVEFIDFQQLPKVKDKPGVYIPEGGKGFYGCRLVFDLSLPPTNDARVRHALNFAINRQLIVDAVLNGDGDPIWGGFIPPGRFGYAQNLEHYYSYDPKKAKALLAEAGWIDNRGDGKLYKDGQPMKLTFMTFGPSWWSQVAVIFQANLLDIGVACDLEIKPWPEYREARTKVLELPEGVPGKANIVGATIWGLDLSDMPVYVGPGGFINFNRYNNPKLRETLREAFSTTDDARREEMLRSIQAMMLEDAPDITPCWITRSEVARTAVKNFHHLSQDGCYGTLLWQSYLDPK